MTHKRKYIYLTATLIVALLLHSCTSYTVYPVKSKPVFNPKGGMLYALPKTRVCVTVTFEKRNFDNAPFAEFASEMLGVSKSEMDNPYSISDISIEGSNIADQNYYYFIYPKRLSVNIDSRHLLRSVGITHEEYEEYEAYTERRNHSASDTNALPPSNILYDRADTFYVRGDRAGKPSLISTKKDSRNIRQRAAAAAKRLEEIQEKKQQLLYGDFDDEISTESLKYMIERLSDQEQALIQQFVGSTSRESVRFYVDPKCDRASLDSQTVVLFAFSPKDGLATGNNIKAGMDTVFCNIQSQNSLRSASRFVKQQTSGRRKDDTAGARRTFKYRQAETAHVAVYSNQFCFESDVRIAQFGPIVDLPKHPFEAIFDRNTGDLIYYKN